MKLIEKKEAVKAEVVPELIFGEKYITTGEARSNKFPIGTEVLLIKSTIDDDGEVEVGTEERTGWIEPKNLKPVTVKVTKLVKGNKYITTGKSWGGVDLTGKSVILNRAEPDMDGDISVGDGVFEYCVKPEQLTPFSEDTSATFTVELTEAEVAVIHKVIGRTAPYERRQYFEGEAVSFDAGSVGSEIFDGFQQLLKGGR